MGKEGRKEKVHVDIRPGYYLIRNGHRRVWHACFWIVVWWRSKLGRTDCESGKGMGWIFFLLGVWRDRGVDVDVKTKWLGVLWAVESCIPPGWARYMNSSYC